MLDDALGGEVSRMLSALDAGFPAVHEMTGAQARALVAERAQPVDNIDDVRATEDLQVETPGGTVAVRVYHPHGDADRRPGVVFFHGGGFVFCSVESHDGFCRRVARYTDSVVVSVEYRLAPEHRAPVAAEDGYGALCWVAEHADDLGIDLDRLVTAGDSAGGNLAAVVPLMARDRGGPALKGQVLLYPVLEPDFRTESYERYATGHFNTRAAMRWYWEQYLGGDPELTSLPEPPEYVVPIRAASLAGLPPAVVVTAGRDPLSDEGRRYVESLRGDGVSVRHRHYPDLFHGFATIGPFGPATSARELLWSDLTALMEAPDRAGCGAAQPERTNEGSSR